MPSGPPSLPNTLLLVSTLGFQLPAHLGKSPPPSLGALEALPYLVRIPRRAPLWESSCVLCRPVAACLWQESSDLPVALHGHSGGPETCTAGILLLHLPGSLFQHGKPWFLGALLLCMPVCAVCLFRGSSPDITLPCSQQQP